MATLRPDALDELRQIADAVGAERSPVQIEAHTDERRAALRPVRLELGALRGPRRSPGALPGRRGQLRPRAPLRRGIRRVSPRGGSAGRGARESRPGADHRGHWRLKGRLRGRLTGLKRAPARTDTALISIMAQEETKPAAESEAAAESAKTPAARLEEDPDRGRRGGRTAGAGLRAGAGRGAAEAPGGGAARDRRALRRRHLAPERLPGEPGRQGRQALPGHEHPGRGRCLRGGLRHRADHRCACTRRA